LRVDGVLCSASVQRVREQSFAPKLMSASSLLPYTMAHSRARSHCLPLFHDAYMQRDTPPADPSSLARVFVVCLSRALLGGAVACGHNGVFLARAYGGAAGEGAIQWLLALVV